MNQHRKSPGNTFQNEGRNLHSLNRFIKEKVIKNFPIFFQPSFEADLTVQTNITLNSKTEPKIYLKDIFMIA